ncbi:hypothetical protein BRL81_22900, partial [Xanthomonas oryzae pv. oryzae]
MTVPAAQPSNQRRQPPACTLGRRAGRGGGRRANAGAQPEPGQRRRRAGRAGAVGRRARTVERRAEA